MNTTIDPGVSEGVFATPEILRDAFENRLTELLGIDRLGVYIPERVIQDGNAHGSWATEMAGAITLGTAKDFVRLSESDLGTGYRRLAVTP